MKRNLCCLCMAIIMAMTVSAQVSDNPATAATVKLGISYVHDLPGLNGMGVHGEYGFPITDWIQVETGFKRIQASGYPRTETVKEYTKSTTFDFNVLFVPFSSENSTFKIGGGYSFVFYNLRRSIPVFSGAGTAKEESWQVVDTRSMTNGCSLIGEYEYYISANVSAGARVSLAKAYSGHVWMGGPFVAIKL
ncbi:MAG TPA: hypothetical protein VLD19_05275 [Chitinophagaceae bacterium]|nr:hypothetical protein [Chitinophagaceae bacterium]